MRVLDGQNGWLDPVVISPDNKRIVARDSKGTGLRQFDLSDGSLRNGYHHPLSAMCFFPDSDHILIALEDILLRVDWETGRQDMVYPRGGDPNEIFADGVYQMLVNPVGELVTLGMDAGYENYLVSRWKADKGIEIKRVSELKLESKEYLTTALSPDGSKVIAVFEENSPKAGGAVILSVPKFKELGSFETPIDSPKQQLLMSPTGNQIVARGEGKSFFAWDGPYWETRREVKIGGRRMLTGLAYHPSGKRLAVACNDETVRVFDTSTWEEVSKFTWKSGRLRSITYSADGTLAAAGSDTGKVIVWDVDE
jgi:WD40 repeat protein